MCFQCCTFRVADEEFGTPFSFPLPVVESDLTGMHSPWSVTGFFDSTQPNLWRPRVLYPYFLRKHDWKFPSHCSPTYPISKAIPSSKLPAHQNRKTKHVSNLHPQPCRDCIGHQGLFFSWTSFSWWARPPHKHAKQNFLLCWGLLGSKFFSRRQNLGLVHVNFLHSPVEIYNPISLCIGPMGWKAMLVSQLGLMSLRECS